jgi:hypothetical protein
MWKRGKGNYQAKALLCRKLKEGLMAYASWGLFNLKNIELMCNDSNREPWNFEPE